MKHQDQNVLNEPGRRRKGKKECRISFEILAAGSLVLTFKEVGED